MKKGLSTRCYPATFDPHELLTGVPGITTHICDHERLTPDALQTVLCEVLNVGLGKDIFPIVSRHGVAFPLPDLTLRRIGEWAAALREVSQAGGSRFEVDQDLTVRSSVLSVRTNLLSGGVLPENTDECRQRVLSILRFRTRHRMHGLTLGNVLSVPLHERCRDIREGHIESAVAIAEQFLADAYVQDIDQMENLTALHDTLRNNATTPH